MCAQIRQPVSLPSQMPGRVLSREISIVTCETMKHVIKVLSPLKEQERKASCANIRLAGYDPMLEVRVML